MKYVVEIQQGCFLTIGQGDPSRTMKLQNAKVFNRESDAKRDLTKARKYRKLSEAKIKPVSISIDQALVEGD